MVKISEIMRKKFVYFDVDDTVSAAMHAMQHHHIEQAPVIVRGRFAGLVRATRLARLILKAKLFGGNEFSDAHKAGARKVGNFAMPHERTVKSTDDVAEGVAAFAMTGDSQVYVLDKKRKVVGMVHAKDLLGHMGHLMAAKRAAPQMIKIAQQEQESSPRQATTIDEVLRYVRKNGATNVDAIAKHLNITPAEVEDYAEVLQKSGYIKIDYGLLGMAKLRSV